MMCVTTCCFINPCLLFFQSKIRRKKSKWSKSEDEGFESPNSPPLSPVDHQPESFPEPQKAPLANEEDLESVEKYETEVTKEKDGEAKKELSVRIFIICFNFSLRILSLRMSFSNPHLLGLNYNVGHLS